MSDSDRDDDGGRLEREILVLYASETGNALDAAEHITRHATTLRFRVRIHSTDDYPMSDLIHEAFVVFVVSTIGAGQEPRSMSGLWKMLLRSDLPDDLFEGLDFAVFGLGDSSYETFCWAAKKLARRLQSLGARDVYRRGEGDDQHVMGFFGGLDKWMKGLFKNLEESFLPSSEPIAIPSDALFPPRISLIQVSNNPETPPANGQRHAFIKTAEYHEFTVSCNRRITAADCSQDVRHIELDTKDEIEYKPGDVAVIHPIPRTDDVELFLTTVRWGNDADEPLHFVQPEGALPVPQYIPRRTTLREIFTHFLDFNCVPRRTFFTLLRHFAADSLEKEKLEEFCSEEGADELYDYCTQPRRTIHEVLAEFRSIQIPKEYIFDVFPLLRPREFSIASSIKVFPKQIHLCVAIVQYKTKLKIPRRGVCTSYLSQLLPGDTVTVGIQKGVVSLSDDIDMSKPKPVICVGPGTGIAPIRALLGERIQAGITANTLYFGCRSQTKDYHYAEQWKKYADAGKLDLKVAFSRDSQDGSKTYVQDLMVEEAAQIWDLLHDQGGWLYISGSSNKMPTGVKAAVRTAAMSVGGKSEEDARTFIKNLQSEGRLVEECWG